MLAIARNPAAVALPADLVSLIERTFRYTYMIAMKMRDDMTRVRGADGPLVPRRGALGRTAPDPILLHEMDRIQGTND